MISPDVIAGTSLEHCVEREPFTVKTAHATTRHEHVAILPLPNLFNTDIHHKFLLFDFDPKYKGLIGMDKTYLKN